MTRLTLTGRRRRPFARWWRRLTSRLVEHIIEHAQVAQARLELCVLCGEKLDPIRMWADHLGGYVDLGCVPSIVRARGTAAIRLWLRTGQLSAVSDVAGATPANTYSQRHTGKRPHPGRLTRKVHDA